MKTAPRTLFAAALTLSTLSWSQPRAVAPAQPTAAPEIILTVVATAASAFLVGVPLAIGLEGVDQLIFASKTVGPEAPVVASYDEAYRAARHAYNLLDKGHPELARGYLAQAEAQLDTCVNAIREGGPREDRFFTLGAGRVNQEGLRNGVAELLANVRANRLVVAQLTSERRLGAAVASVR